MNLDWYLKMYHRGENNAIGGRELAGKLGLVDTRSLRKVVEAARDAGYPICGTPSGKYHWPTCRQDAQHTIAYMADMESKFRRNKLNIIKAIDSMYGEPSLFNEVF